VPSLLEPGGPLVPSVDRMAVLRANGIGDLVVALPALSALRAAYPDAEITYLGAAWHPTLLRDRPGPWDRILVVPHYPGVNDGEGASQGSPEVHAFFAAQQRERYDLAIQLHGGGGNSNPFVSALGARVTAGSRAVAAPPLDRTMPYVYYQHEVHRFLEVAGLVGASPVELEPRLQVTPADRAAAAEVLGAVTGPLVGLHPGASDRRRRWPAESFAVVAQELAGRGAQVVLLGHGAEDERAAAEIASFMTTPPLDLVGRLSLRGMVGVLERCCIMVGNDSGPRHLAGAVGTATVAVYWCGNLINSSPLTRRRHRVAVSFRTVCPTCGSDQGRGRCPHDPSFVSDVPVEDVLGPVLDLYVDCEQNPAA
jgi:ADP-heptose:LPS heptosyltransferase